MHIYANYNTVENGAKKFLWKMFRHNEKIIYFFVDSGKNFRVVTYSLGLFLLVGSKNKLFKAIEIRLKLRFTFGKLDVGRN